MTVSENDVTAQRPALSPIGSADVVKHEISRNGVCYDETIAIFWVTLPSGKVLDLGLIVSDEWGSDDDFEYAIAKRRQYINEALTELWSLSSLQRAALAEEASSEGVTSESDTPAEAAP